MTCSFVSVVIVHDEVCGRKVCLIHGGWNKRDGKRPESQYPFQERGLSGLTSFPQTPPPESSVDSQSSFRLLTTPLA